MLIHLQVILKSRLFHCNILPLRQLIGWRLRAASASYHVFIVVSVVVWVSGVGVAVPHQVLHGAAEGTGHCTHRAERQVS